MKETLELKHLAPYLPYGLKGLKISKGNFSCDDDLRTVIELTVSDIGSFLSRSYHIISCKPILRPLSDLNKHITRYEKNEPAYNWLSTDVANLFKEDYSIESIIKNRLTLKTLSFSDAQALFEMHFDVFGLIEKGLAVNINNINEQ